MPVFQDANKVTQKGLVLGSDFFPLTSPDPPGAELDVVFPPTRRDRAVIGLQPEREQTR